MVLSIEFDKVILNASDDKPIALDTYSETSKKIWECIRYLLRALSCGYWKPDDFLAVSLKDKTVVYILPDQIKNGYKKLNVDLPATPISQTTLSLFIQSANSTEELPPPNLKEKELIQQSSSPTIKNEKSEELPPTQQSVPTSPSTQISSTVEKRPLPSTKNEPIVPVAPAKIAPVKVEKITPLQAKSTTLPTVRIRVVQEAPLGIPTSTIVDDALIAKREGVLVQYVLVKEEEECDAAIVIRPYTQRPFSNELKNYLAKNNLTKIPTAVVFVQPISGGEPCLADKPQNTRNVLDVEDDLQDTQIVLLLRCTLQTVSNKIVGINGVDPKADKQNPWNMGQINRFHTFIQQKVVMKQKDS